MLHDGVQRELSFSNLLQRAKAVSDNRARLPDDSVKLYLGLFHAADQTNRGKDDGIGHNRLVKQTANSQSFHRKYRHLRRFGLSVKEVWFKCTSAVTHRRLLDR